MDGNVDGYYAELKLGNAQSTYYPYSAYIRGVQGGGIDYYRLEFGTAAGSAAATRMTIANDGNVGIGTNNPAYKLDVAGSVYSSNYFSVLTAATYGPSDNSAVMQVFGSTGSGGLTNTIKFVTGGSERVRIDSDGNVGIGTTSTVYKLKVQSTGANGLSIQTV